METTKSHCKFMVELLNGVGAVHNIVAPRLLDFLSSLSVHSLRSCTVTNNLATSWLHGGSSYTVTHFCGDLTTGYLH